MTEALAIREKHDGALGDRSSVRLWLRLLSCTMAIEKDVQRRFAERGTTLARFDVLAALDRHGEGMTMGALSRALLVSNGNVTQLVQKLAEGRPRPHRPIARRPPRLDRPADGQGPRRISPASPPPITTGSTRCSADMDARGARKSLSGAGRSSSARSRKDRPLNPETFQPAPFPLGLRRRRRDGHAEPARSGRTR